MKRAILLALLLAGCGGSPQSTSTAYAATVRALKYACTLVQAWPDPPAQTSGGEATP